MDKVVLKATRRDVTGKHVKSLRRQGRLPAVIYGHSFKPIPISLDAHNTSLKLTGISPSTIVTIDLDGEEHATLVREKQKDYIRNSFIHIDFQAVSLTEKIRSAVPVEAHGVSPAVKNFDAVIVTNLNIIDVEAFPQDLPERVIVDISVLEEVGNAIYVRDLVVSDKVQVLTDGDEVVIVATSAAPEIEEEPVAGAEEAEPEVIERGKKEEEEEEE